MARPTRPGIVYFPLDVCSDTKLKLIEAEFGLNGFALVVKLWQKIYAEGGYYCEFDEEVALLFANENHVGGNAVSEILRASFKRGIFDGAMYNKYNILTSHGIQVRYLEATVRRSQVEIENRYLLLTASEIRENVTITGVSVYNNPQNVYSGTQSKVEERKEKQSRAEESIVPPGKRKHTYGAYKNILLSDEELENLKTKFPVNWEQWIEKLSYGIELKDYKYKNHYLAILQWAENDFSKPMTGMPKPSAFNNYIDTNVIDHEALLEQILDQGGMEPQP